MKKAVIFIFMLVLAASALPFALSGCVEKRIEEEKTDYGIYKKRARK